MKKMAHASVLTDTEIRRVFRIIETTRHAEKNRLAFTLSIYAGLRVGEIAALTVSDVATAGRYQRRSSSGVGPVGRFLPLKRPILLAHRYQFSKSTVFLGRRRFPYEPEWQE